MAAAQHIHIAILARESNGLLMEDVPDGRTFGLEWRGLPPGLVGRDQGLAVGGEAGSQRRLVRLVGHPGQDPLIRRLGHQIE